MQLHPASKSDKVNSAPFVPTAPDQRAWTFSPLLGWALAALVVFVVSSTVFYLSWDHMPGRVRYLPRYIEAHLLPARPHDAFVATPVAAIAPEAALQSLQLAPLEEATAVAPAVSEPAPVEAQSDATTAAPVVDTQPEVAAPVDAAAPQPVAAPIFQPALPSAQVQGILHEYQGWNNCGPATLAMNLSFYGRTETQKETAPFLKPDENDKNVSPSELAAYATSIGYGSKVIVGSDLEMLRTLISNNMPVIVESWYIPDPNDEMGHYLLLTGYNGETFNFFDSYKGPNVQESAAEFDALWKVFNRTAIVLWPPEKEALALAILGERAEPRAMYEKAMRSAHEEINANPQDKFAWFNLGTNLTALGDVPNAIRAFDTARSLPAALAHALVPVLPLRGVLQRGQLPGSSDPHHDDAEWRGQPGRKLLLARSRPCRARPERCGAPRFPGGAPPQPHFPTRAGRPGCPSLATLILPIARRDRGDAPRFTGVAAHCDETRNVIHLRVTFLVSCLIELYVPK